MIENEKQEKKIKEKKWKKEEKDGQTKILTLLYLAIYE